MSVLADKPCYWQVKTIFVETRNSISSVAWQSSVTSDTTIISSPAVWASELFADLSSRIVEFVWCRALLGLHSQTLH